MKTLHLTSLAALSVIGLFVAGVRPLAQSGLPNPYRPVKGLADGRGLMVPGGDWARLPGGREMGPPASMHVDIDGESIWAFIRCDETNPVTVANGGRFGIDCLDANGRIKNIDTIYKFDAKGNVVKSFGAGMFIWPHGLHVDREGNVWGTDAATQDAVAMAAKAGGKFGHQVIKFSPDGKVLMRLGEAGVPGSDERHFMSPSAVAVAANGDIFVADGHGANENNRVVKLSKEGKFIKAWGKTGTALVSSIHCTPSQSIHAGACSSPIAATTGFRFSIRRASTSRRGCSSARRAGLRSTTRIRSTWPTPSRTT